MKSKSSEPIADSLGGHFDFIYEKVTAARGIADLMSAADPGALCDGSFHYAAGACTNLLYEVEEVLQAFMEGRLKRPGDADTPSKR